VRDKINARKAEDKAQAQAEVTPEPVAIGPAAPHFETVTGDSVLDRFSEAASWSDILATAGWTEAKVQDSDTIEAWKRPGGTYPISAKVPKVAPWSIVAWSTDAGLPAGADQHLNKAKVYAHLYYGGDLSAASKALLRGDAIGLPAHVAEACKGTGSDGPRASRPPQENAPDQESAAPAARWLDLGAYLDGTYEAPQPSLGAKRQDGISLLYRAMWHTCIGLTTAGKTTFALWHVRAVLLSGEHVVYIHFEEANPNGIIHRLIALGIPPDVIRERFHWGHVNSPWQWGEMAREIESLERPPALALLDGINAACGMHGWDVKEANTVGAYRRMFVHPLTSVGAGVLSLGHPPKAVNRQGESYSYGAAGWLNDVDGVSFRMTASKHPISKGVRGSSALHVVKDRYGEVQRWGELQSDGDMPRWYMGQFVVDDSSPEDLFGSTSTGTFLAKPVKNEEAKNQEGQDRDKIDALCDEILTHLRETTGKFASTNQLITSLRAKDVKFAQSDAAPAMERLALRKSIVWPEVPDRKPRPGWLAEEEESE